MTTDHTASLSLEDATMAHDYALRCRYSFERAYTGALGEIGTWQVFSASGHEPTKPDLTQWSEARHGADMRLATGESINVKTSADVSIRPNLKGRFVASWMFQPNDPLIVNPKPSDLIILAIRHRNSSGQEEIHIKHILRATEIKCWRKPLHKNKIELVLYDDDLN